MRGSSTPLRGTLLLVAALALGSAPASALATPSDLAATHAYIQANYALGKASLARFPVEQAAIERLNGQLARECPAAGSGSPENELEEPVAYGMAVALFSVAYRADAGPIQTFVKTVGHLRWSNQRIKRLAAKYAGSLHEYATLPLPHVCEDVRSWKASGFRVVPAEIASQVAHEEAIVAEAIPAELLAPYERGADAGTVARTTLLETKVEEHEFIVGQGDWYQVLETLQLAP